MVSGRTKWRPRALGDRSILANPRDAGMRDMIDSRIKRREMFRPFPPAIIEKAAPLYFEQPCPSPFMLMDRSSWPDVEASPTSRALASGTSLS